MRTIKYLVSGDSSSPDSIEAPVEQSVKMVTETCGLKMVRVESGWQMRFIADPNLPVAGRQDANWIKLNPNYVKDNSSSYYVVTHEILHYLGFAHSSDPNSNMHPDGNRYFSASEVQRLQSKYGSPDKIWYPYDKKLVGNTFRDFARKREALLEKRDAYLKAEKYPEMLATQQQVLKNLEYIKEYWNKWHALDLKWSKVKMAG